MSTFKVKRWLGENPSQWKYVYFSEPDLVLHTRPHGLEAIAQKLQQQHGTLMAAHRFNLLPHAVDFPYYPWPGKLIPNQDVFSYFHDLAPLSGDACCDAGEFHPGEDDYDYCWRWFDCGTRQQEEAITNVTRMREAHKRIVGYPMVRLTTGLRVPLVQEHARRCVPVRNGECSVDKK